MKKMGFFDFQCGFNKEGRKLVIQGDKKSLVVYIVFFLFVKKSGRKGSGAQDSELSIED